MNAAIIREKGAGMPYYVAFFFVTLLTVAGFVRHGLKTNLRMLPVILRE
jgi:hypothetical protein